MSISYAVFPRALPPFPTRRSSDLMPERRVPEIMAKGDGFGEIGIESQSAGDRAGDLRHLERMRETGAIVVALVSDEYLRLLLQSPKRRSEEHTSELQSHVNLVCRLPPSSSPFPYTTLFRSHARTAGARDHGQGRWFRRDRDRVSKRWRSSGRSAPPRANA